MAETRLAEAKPAATKPLTHVAQRPAAKKVPKFKRQNSDMKKRVGDAWRKPRGIDNKQRVQKKGYGPLPRIGYRTPRAGRYNHPLGMKEVLVSSMRELAGLKGVAVRFSAALGRRKKVLLVAEAKKMQLRILNE